MQLSEMPGTLRVNVVASKFLSDLFLSIKVKS